ncbi:MAG: acyltransferase family protein [Pseudonocardiaceae bacterium]
MSGPAAPPGDAATTENTGSPRRGRFVVLEMFRAVAASVVVYGHIVGLWLPSHHISTPVVGVIDRVFRIPLHLTQNFAHLGVVLFFLVSGFIITHTGVRQRHREFAVKRLLRIYPPLAVAVVLCTALITFGLQPLTTGQDATITPVTMLTNATLVNYLLVPQVVLIGVAWTLIIEMIFYGLTFLILPLLRRAVPAAIALELLLVWVVVLTARQGGAHWFLFAVSFSYLPVLLLGQIVWAVWSRRAPLWAGVALGITTWLLYVWAGSREMGRIDDAYELTAVIALLIFLIGLLAEPRLRLSRPMAFLADRSYSIYLVHGLVAFPVMDLLLPVTPLVVAVAGGILVVVVVADLNYRLVERPSQRLARMLLRRPRHTATTNPAGQSPAVAGVSSPAGP